MNKREIKKMFPYLSEGTLSYELKHERAKYKTEQGFIKHLEKENKKCEEMFTMPDIERISFDVTWKRSRTWGNCPRAEWRCWFKDGTYMHGSEYASGYGYDKLSTVLADAFNKVGKGMLWRKRYSRKKAPYGIPHVGTGSDRKWNPYFEGGIGANCYKNIAAYLGGSMEWDEGKTWDSFEFTFK